MNAGGFHRNKGGIFRAVYIFGTLALLGVLVVGFQNCTSQVPVDVDAIASLEASKVEFAYDASIDQITYMSCAKAAPGSFDAGPYFSFRVGAYRNAGLRLTDTFRTMQGKKPVERQSELLTESPANASTGLQFAIRQKANFQIVYTGSGTAVRGQDYVNVLPPLGTFETSDLLVGMNSTDRLKYVRNGTVYGSRLEGSLYFTKDPTLANSIRSYLTNDAMLAMTYAHAPSGSTDDYFARSPRDVIEGSTANRGTQVYGKGFTLAFMKPVIGATASNANFPNVILREVVESNLMNPNDRTAVATWSCPDTLRFRIVRPEDAKAGTAVTCVTAADPAVPSAELAVVRNQLRVEDWYVDMTNKCIVPKKTPATCYGSTATTIQYDITQSCVEDGATVCVNFASVCYRP